MKVKVEKAEKALGFTYLAHLFNLEIASIPLRLSGKTEDELLKKLKEAEEDWEQYQKPGFREKRPMKVVSKLPEDVRDETIYIVFEKNGYAIKSGRNFIHKPVIAYGNLRYVSITEVEYSKEEVLEDMKRLNNCVLS